MVKIDILGHEFVYRSEDPSIWTGTGMGRSSVKDALILTNAGMAPSVQASTLLHEIVHVIADLLSVQASE
jgi:hypothetical protein